MSPRKIFDSSWVLSLDAHCERTLLLVENYKFRRLLLLIPQKATTFVTSSVHHQSPKAHSPGLIPFPAAMSSTSASAPHCSTMIQCGSSIQSLFSLFSFNLLRWSSSLPSCVRSSDAGPGRHHGYLSNSSNSLAARGLWYSNSVLCLVPLTGSLHPACHVHPGESCLPP